MQHVNVGFDHKLVLDFESSGKWIVEEPFSYYGYDYTVHVSRGFETDLASIPALARIMLRPDGAYTQAAVMHDYLYRNHTLTREEADDLFYEAMVVTKVPAWQRMLLYRAVRLFGWLYY